MSVIVFTEFLQGKNFRVQMGNENIYIKFLWYLLDATHMPTLPALKGTGASTRPCVLPLGQRVKTTYAAVMRCLRGL